MIRAEIITIGDELLIGQVLDTNSAWLGQRLNEIGIKVFQVSTVGDNPDHMLTAFREASERAQLVIITGGLGPTKDDLTKKVLCDYFKTTLVFDQGSFQNIERIFRARGREVNEINRMQAELPLNSAAMLNVNGTAPGMWFEENNVVYISMPGVPYEMKGIMHDVGLPRLKEKFQLPPVLHKNILTQGIGESWLSELIAPWEDQLPSHIRLAYLPSTGMVRLRLTGSGRPEEILRSELEVQTGKMLELAGKYVYGYDDDSLESIVGALLRDRKQTLSIAESCTGGFIAHRITSVPGCSDYFTGSIVAYDNKVKVNFLNVARELLDEKGAVCEETAVAMSEGARRIFKTDYALASTGIAGPGGGSDQKPVGLVWISLSLPDGKSVTRKLNLGTVRDRVIMEACSHSLHLLIKKLKNEEI